MLKDLSMIKIVEQLLVENDAPLELKKIFGDVAEIKGFSITDYETLNQLYLDIVTSASFVYMGHGLWDLKDRNLEYWSKDGTDFLDESSVGDPAVLEGYKEVNFANVPQEKIESIIGVEADDKEDLDFDDFDDEELLDLEDLEELEDLDEEEKIALIEEKQYIADELNLLSTDEDDIGLDFDDIKEEDYDEESYHEIMDEYEDMY